jgi:hypothetical protein
MDQIGMIVCSRLTRRLGEVRHACPLPVLSSQMKAGPPMRAVKTPTGILPAPKSMRLAGGISGNDERGSGERRGRHQRAMLRADDQARGVRRDQAHERDRAGNRHRHRGERSGQEEQS